MNNLLHETNYQDAQLCTQFKKNHSKFMIYDVNNSCKLTNVKISCERFTVMLKFN